MEKDLEKLDGEASRTKRQAIDNEENDDFANTTNGDADLLIKSTTNQIKLPDKQSSPAFSIHAQKVYIIYPSLFQDPNIFGRFSMPQSVNLDSNQKKSIGGTPGNSLAAPNTRQFPTLNQNPLMNLHPQGKRLMRRNAPLADDLAQAKDEEKKRNVETHLNGTIVVLNQDVNEYNRKGAYWCLKAE